MQKILYPIRLLVVMFMFLSVGTPVTAGDTEPELKDVPEPPDIPPAIESGEPIEPEVTIIKKQDATVYEHRINGRLYMVKIVPLIGKPYYLVDQDAIFWFEDFSVEDHTADQARRTNAPFFCARSEAHEKVRRSSSRCFRSCSATRGLDRAGDASPIEYPGSFEAWPRLPSGFQTDRSLRLLAW